MRPSKRMKLTSERWEAITGELQLIRKGRGILVPAASGSR